MAKKAKKKISTKKQLERKQKLKLAKKQKLWLIGAAIPPFAFTITLIILYALKFVYPWLFITTAFSWFALGGLFVYAAVKKWGYVTIKGDPCEKNSSVITIYNIVLLFALGVLFAVLFFREIL